MNRREFTKNIVELLQEMIAAGENPILDYALRSALEQRRLYKAGLSKCDGFKILSAHQRGTACDIYLVQTKPKIKVYFEWDKLKAGLWHNIWQRKGGKRAISWDPGHFEG